MVLDPEFARKEAVQLARRTRTDVKGFYEISVSTGKEGYGHTT